MGSIDFSAIDQGNYLAEYPAHQDDLRIFDMLSHGETVTKITLEIPCSRASVDRAKERATRFLIQKEFKKNPKFMGIPLHEIRTFAPNFDRSPAIYNQLPSVAALKMHHLAIFAFQNGDTHTIPKNEFHKIIPDLFDKSKRRKALSELQNLQFPVEASLYVGKNIYSIFDYDGSHYHFTLSPEAQWIYGAYGLLPCKRTP